jgi:hypothetical protein
MIFQALRTERLSPSEIMFRFGLHGSPACSFSAFFRGWWELGAIVCSIPLLDSICRFDSLCSSGVIERFFKDNGPMTF